MITICLWHYWLSDLTCCSCCLEKGPCEKVAIVCIVLMLLLWKNIALESRIYIRKYHAFLTLLIVNFSWVFRKEIWRIFTFKERVGLPLQITWLAFYWTRTFFCRLHTYYSNFYKLALFKDLFIIWKFRGIL